MHCPAVKAQRRYRRGEIYLHPLPRITYLTVLPQFITTAIE